MIGPVEKNQQIFNNKVAQGNILYEMKSCLENAQKIYRGEKGMRRREEMVVASSRNSAWSSKRHFKEVTQGEVHLYTFFLLCISLRKELSHLAPLRCWQVWQSALG